MREDREPLYNLRGELLGHSVTLVVGDHDAQALDAHDRYPPSYSSHPQTTEYEQYIAGVRGAVNELRRDDLLSVERRYSARDRETTYWYFANVRADDQSGRQTPRGIQTTKPRRP